MLADHGRQGRPAPGLVQPRLAGNLVIVQLQVIEAVGSLGSSAAGFGHVVVRLGRGDAQVLPLEVVLVEHRFLPALRSCQSTALEFLLDHVEGLHGGRVVVVVVELNRLLHALSDEVLVRFALNDSAGSSALTQSGGVYLEVDHDTNGDLGEQDDQEEGEELRGEKL